MAGLVLSLKNLEEHVMPAVMERLNRVERDEGKKVSGKEYIKEAEEAELEAVTKEKAEWNMEQVLADMGEIEITKKKKGKISEPLRRRNWKEGTSKWLKRLTRR